MTLWAIKEEKKTVTDLIISLFHIDCHMWYLVSYLSLSNAVTAVEIGADVHC